MRSNGPPAMLYGSNTYSIAIDPYPRPASSLSTPTIFGQLGQPNRLHLLRELRSVSLILMHGTGTPYWVNKRHGTGSSYWVNTRQRGRLKLFVDILKEHAGDTNHGTASLLTNLTLEFWRGFTDHSGNFIQGDSFARGMPPTKAEAEAGQFCLEALLPLHGINKVTVGGMVSPWFAQCLTLSLQSNDEAMKPAEIEFPSIEVQRKVGKRWRTSTVSTWQWHMPTVDWKGFARRNGIELPDDVDRFWETSREVVKLKETKRVGGG